MKAFPVHLPNSSSPSTVQGGTSKNKLQRGALSPPHLPSPAISQLRPGPHTPSVLLSYQQEPTEHTADFLHHKNNSTDHCHSPLPSSPSSPAPRQTNGCARCTYLISPDMGTSQKATPVLIWRSRQSLQEAATAPLAKRGTLQHHCKAYTELDTKQEVTRGFSVVYQ